MGKVLNPYFEFRNACRISSIEALLSLSEPQAYYEPGDKQSSTNGLGFPIIPHETSGLFRGQIENWLLVPKAFRGYSKKAAPKGPVTKILAWVQATQKFRWFCERAERQNPDFPVDELDRMCIAQHFGIPTPLLDWSRNVLAALFFAVRDIFSNEKFQEHLRVYIYHIPDERLLGKPISRRVSLDKQLASGYVHSKLSDRRIERQQGAFTFHPHPVHAPEVVPVDVYVCSYRVTAKAVRLMKGLGHTEDYYFPDYAGIAAAVMSETAL